MRRLHFYAGILIAPFLIVAAVTGGAYAVAPTIEEIVYRDQLHTDSTGEMRPVSEQVEAAQRVRPDLTLSAVRPPAEPGDTTRVLFDDPSLGESERQAVFVDPVTTEIKGELVSYGSAAALPMRAWLSSLHRNLHLGEPGRVYSELAASWLWVVALGGVALWVSYMRRRRSARHLVTFDGSATGRNRTRNRHAVVGVWIAVGLVFLSATGLTWSKYTGDNVTGLRTALHWTTPAVNTDLPSGAFSAAASGAGHHHGATHADAHEDPTISTRTVKELDRVLDVARSAGVGSAVEASIPSAPDEAFTVTQTRRPWQFGPDSVAVDGATGRIVDESRFADWPVAARLTNWGISLHMGILLGWVSQVGLLLLAVALVAIIVRGYQMWWQRRPRHSGSFGVDRPPVRGALRRMSRPSALALVAVTAVVGWFIPLLGISLLAFLIVDVALGLRANRRRAQEKTATEA
ncbi:PepSY domain-containing protein [Gordonia sp. B21]|uniref:PepSY-associated TM helix domain-containing protein n=1 Tax=Gordonia sp. B21 TaxID=3151852 RepID=UPI003262DA83